ncbi:hypothetical protein KKC08_04215, partial [Patescibacteria group bacterium]|nr:hypothetical protein [Patescibacteria group bacterium]
TEQETEEEETEMTVEIVVNDNTAIVETETNADSNTGQNLIEESTTAEVETGDAGSETETDNLINLNQVDVGATLISPLETEVIIAIPKEIFNINTAEVENQATSSANTGANQIDIATQSAEIKTGDALAIANMVNVVNTNIVGSKINVYVTNKLDGEITEVLPTRK